MSERGTSYTDLSLSKVHTLHGESGMLFEQFSANLDRAKPYLFQLAHTVVDTYADRSWDVLVGDDTSGRLSTRFIRKALHGNGIDIPTRYICASQKARDIVPKETYDAYTDYVADRLPGEASRVLAITESLGLGDTASFIESTLERRFDEVDFALVVSRFGEHTKLAGNVYIGGEGEEAARAVFYTFEELSKPDINKKAREVIKNIIPKKAHKVLSRHTGLKKTSSHPLTNLETPDVDYPLPFARLTGDRTHRSLARACYKRIDQLAAEFTHANTS